MINRLRLRNWKSYSELSVGFVGGCNFLIAENGVGKTGLIQAIYFGLFGDGALLSSRSPVLAAIRGTERSAEVELTVTFGDEQWIVRREVQRATPSARLISHFATDGVERTEEDWLGRLAAESLVDPVQLRLLCAVPEGASSPAELDAPDRYNLAAHLSSVLGATKLTDLAKQFEAQSITIAKEANDIRLTERDRPQKASDRKLDTLRAELDAASSRLAAARTEYLRLAAAQAAQSEWQQWGDWADESRTRAVQALEIWSEPLTDVAHLLELDPPGTRIEADLHAVLSEYGLARVFAAETVGRLRQLYSDRASELATYEAKVEACRSSMELLSHEDAICPTCLRPMSTTERMEAIDRNRERIAELQPGIDDLRASQLRLVELGQQVAAISSAPELEVRPTPAIFRPTDDESPTAELMEAARTTLTKQEADVRDLEAEVKGIEISAQRLAENDALSKRLQRMYRAGDIYAVTATTFGKVAEAMCAGRIEPLAIELAKRWNEVWPDRPTIRLDDNGAVIANANGAQLDLVDLSGGERAVAMILLRILAAQAASQCPFLLLDEPLEHLDPTNRRMLANLLSAAGRAGPSGTRQLIVTTYEETVARRLGTSDHTQIVYVRSG
jgi:DNA repair exonuclease SbcCD ATPase subunit